MSWTIPYCNIHKIQIDQACSFYNVIDMQLQYATYKQTNSKLFERNLWDSDIIFKINRSASSIATNWSESAVRAQHKSCHLSKMCFCFVKIKSVICYVMYLLCRSQKILSLSEVFFLFSALHFLRGVMLGFWLWNWIDKTSFLLFEWFKQNFEMFDVKHKALISNLMSNVFHPISPGPVTTESSEYAEMSNNPPVTRRYKHWEERKQCFRSDIHRDLLNFS